MRMPKFHSPVEAEKDIVAFMAIRHDDEIETGITTAVETQEATGTSVISASKIEDGTSTSPIQDRTSSVSQNAWPWYGGWTPGAGPLSGQWGGTPTTVITLASTVTYTEPYPTADISQSPSLDPTTSQTRTDRPGISGPAAAGIGVSASVGLLGLCLAALYFCRKRSCRRRHQSPRIQRSESVTISDAIWPPYPYSASNESPVELSAVRQPKEMCAETGVREKDVSNHSEVAELHAGGLVIREAGIMGVESCCAHQQVDTRSSDHGILADSDD
ncbi:hypothetical protein F4824DRAFT_482130 [Ustulina deusta]|nr:hypothetical protein F4824DRAFT_482130 [Ustulina deusta]